MSAPEGMVWVSGERLQKLLDERAEALRLLDMAYRGADYAEGARALFLAVGTVFTADTARAEATEPEDTSGWIVALGIGPLCPGCKGLPGKHRAKCPQAQESSCDCPSGRWAKDPMAHLAECLARKAVR